MIALLVSLLLSAVAIAGELKFCIQVAADGNLETIKSYYERVKELPDARIEKRGNLYLLRIGAESSRKDLFAVYRRVKKLFKDAYIKKCEIDQKYVVYPVKEKSEPSAVVSEKTEKETPNGRSEKSDVKTKDTYENQGGVKQETVDLTPIADIVKVEIRSLRYEIEELKRIVKEEKSKNTEAQQKDPAYLEKFLYSAGMFIGGLFLFTWFLLILLYRKVGSANIENANLLNDMFKLIKVLNLLSKGKVIRMENGKLMVYDPKKERWDEVE